METGMIMIAVVLFTVILVPTLVLIQNTKKQSKKLFNGLNAVVAQKNGVLSQHTEQYNFALGIDKTHKTLYFFKKSEETETSQIIDLTDIKSCEIVSKTRRIKKDKGFDEMLETIHLEFISKKSIEVVQLELYNEAESLLTDELAIAENWKKIVQGVLSERNSVIEQKNEQQVATAVA